MIKLFPDKTQIDKDPEIDGNIVSKYHFGSFLFILKLHMIFSHRFDFAFFFIFV